MLWVQFETLKTCVIKPNSNERDGEAGFHNLRVMHFVFGDIYIVLHWPSCSRTHFRINRFFLCQYSKSQMHVVHSYRIYRTSKSRVKVYTVLYHKEVRSQKAFVNFIHFQLAKSCTLGLRNIFYAKNCFSLTFTFSLKKCNF